MNLTNELAELGVRLVADSEDISTPNSEERKKPVLAVQLTEGCTSI